MARRKCSASLRSLPCAHSGSALRKWRGVLKGEAEDLEPILAVHQSVLEANVRQLASTIERVRGLRANLERGHKPTVEELTRLRDSATELSIEFELPWPWGGELFKLREMRPLNYIVGPLGSGKTRLALRLAEVLPAAIFLDLERRVGDDTAAARLTADPALRSRVDQTLAWLVETALPCLTPWSLWLPDWKPKARPS